MESFKSKHIWSSPPTIENVETIFVSVDTMDSFFSYGVFAWDVNDNLYLIACGEIPYLELTEEKRAALDEDAKANGKPPVKTIEDLLDKEFLSKDGIGIKPTMLVIDQGGHRHDEVQHFANFHSNVVQWKGTAMASASWKLSDNQKKLAIGNEKYFKVQLIYSLYSQKDRNANYFYIAPGIDDEMIKQIVTVKPDPSQKWRRPTGKLECTTWRR